MKKFLSAALSVLVMLQGVCFADNRHFDINGTNQNAVVELKPNRLSSARLIYISHDNIAKFIEILEKNRDKLKKIEDILSSDAVSDTSMALGIGTMFAGLIGAGALVNKASTSPELSKESVRNAAGAISSAIGGIVLGTGIILAPTLAAVDLKDKNRSQWISSRLGRSSGSIACQTRWGTHTITQPSDAKTAPDGLILKNVHYTQHALSSVDNFIFGVDELIYTLKTLSDNDTHQKEANEKAGVLHSDKGNGIIISFIVDPHGGFHGENSISIKIYKQGECESFESDNRNSDFTLNGKLVLEGLYAEKQEDKTMIFDVFENAPSRGIYNPTFELSGREIATVKTFNDIDSKLIENMFSVDPEK